MLTSIFVKQKSTEEKIHLHELHYYLVFSLSISFYLIPYSYDTFHDGVPSCLQAGTSISYTNMNK